MAACETGRNVEIKRAQTRVGHPRRDVADIVGHILHTTGDKDEAKILNYYATSSEGICPHYFVNYTGDVYQFCDLDRVAYHAGYGKADLGDGQAELYAAGLDVWTRRINRAPWKLDEPSPIYDWWKTRWPGLASPLDLPFGDKPNRRSVGIELQEPTDEMSDVTPDHFTDAQYARAAELVLSSRASLRMSAPLDARHVVGHSDVTPISRSNKRGGWDPGPRFNWARFLSLCGAT